MIPRTQPPKYFVCLTVAVWCSRANEIHVCWRLASEIALGSCRVLWRAVLSKRIFPHGLVACVFALLPLSVCVPELLAPCSTILDSGLIMASFVHSPGFPVSEQPALVGPVARTVSSLGELGRGLPGLYVRAAGRHHGQHVRADGAGDREAGTSTGTERPAAAATPAAAAAPAAVDVCRAKEAS